MAVAFVLLNVNMGTEEEVLRRLKGTGGVEEAFRVYGVYDIVVKLKAESTEKVKELVQEKVRRINDVRSTLTMLAV